MKRWKIAVTLVAFASVSIRTPAAEPAPGAQHDEVDAPLFNINEPLTYGERLTRDMIGPGVVEDMATVLARQEAQAAGATEDPKARNGAQGEWVIPSRRSTFYPHSGEHYVTNKWGDTRMGIGFPQPVDVQGAYFAGQGNHGAWTAGIRAIGFRDGEEVDRTEWLTGLDETPQWLAMDFAEVDRIVIESKPIHDGAGWYAMDDLTYSIAVEAEDETAAKTIVLDFEDQGFRKTLTGSGYGGLTWETGTGDFKSVDIIHPPQAPPGFDEPAGAETPVSSLRGGLGTLPTMTDDFQAIRYGAGSGASSIPPDTCGAVGPNHFVSIVNRNMSVYTKDASHTRVMDVSLSTFLPGSSGDPRILFDQHSDRWIVLITNFNDRFYVAVSQTDDPTGSWFKTNFVVSAGTDSNAWPDYPTLGVDQNGIYSSAYMVGRGMSMFVIDKAPLIQPSPSLGTVTAFRDLPYEGSIQPAHTYGSAAAEYYVSRISSTSLRVRRVNPPLTNPTMFITGEPSVTSHSSPPDAPALGSGVNLDTGDTRIFHSPVYRDGYLWAAHCISSGGRSAARWYKINATSMNVVESGTVTDPSLYFLYPHIMVNRNGDAVIGMSGSNANQYAGTYFTGRRSDDPAGEMAVPVQYRAGAGSYQILDQYGRNRWGDYSATSLDPNDELTFWTIQEYAHGTNSWGTHVAVLSFGDCNNNGIPDDQEIAGNPSLDCQPDGVLDECQPDCNGNGVADECDISSGNFLDCNNNETPDVCEMSNSVDAFSGTLSPIGTGSPQSFTIPQAPVAEGDVTLSFTARADLASSNERIDVNINGTAVGSVFGSGAEDCPDSGAPDTGQIVVPQATFNAAVGGGDAVINMVATSTVNPNLCNPASFITVAVVYDSSGQGDCNQNGILDTCELADLITGQPAGEVLCPGEDAVFTVTAPNGTGFQWYKDGLPLSDDGVKITGSSTGTLTVQNTDASDESEYYCEVSSGCIAGTSASDSAALTLVGDVNIAVQPPATSTKCAGNTATFQVQVDSLLPSYQWRRNGVPMSSGGRISGVNTAELRIINIIAADSDSYSCVVSNPCGDSEESNPSVLNVVSPVITQQPEDACAEIGGTAVFSVQATSSLAVGYAWEKNGELVSNEAGHISGAQTNTLTIENVVEADAGQYQAITYSSPSPLCFTYSDFVDLTVGGCGPICPAPGDMDGDGDYDLLDMGGFMVCFGADIITEPACVCANVDDSNNVVDLADWEALTPNIAGPH